MPDDTDMLERPESRASRALLTVIFCSVDDGSTAEFDLACNFQICTQPRTLFYHSKPDLEATICSSPPLLPDFVIPSESPPPLPNIVIPSSSPPLPNVTIPSSPPPLPGIAIDLLLPQPSPHLLTDNNEPFPDNASAGSETVYDPDTVNLSILTPNQGGLGEYLQSSLLHGAATMLSSLVPFTY